MEQTQQAEPGGLTGPLRGLLIALALPCYIGASFIALMVANHRWQFGPASDAPLWLALPAIGVLYLGIFCWAFGPIPAGIAVVLVLWEFWRQRSVRRSGVLVPLLVFGALLLWLISVPFFVQALKW